MDDAPVRSGGREPGRDPIGSYEPPAFEVISLDCEITSYAPDGDQPLF